MRAVAAASPAERLSSTESICVPLRRRCCTACEGERWPTSPRSAAAAFNPAHRILAQVLEVARIHGGTDRAGRGPARWSCSIECAAGPAPLRGPLPARGLRRQLQRAMTAMALAGGPDLIVLRRADHRPRRHKPRSRCSRSSAKRCAAWAPPRCTSPTTSRWSPRSPTASRCCATEPEIEEQPTGDLLREPGHAYTRALLGRSRGDGEAPGASYRAAPRGPRNLRVLRPYSGAPRCGPDRTPGPERRRGRRVGQLEVLAERASSAGCWPHTSGRLRFDGEPLSPQARGARSGSAPPHPARLPEPGRGDEPQPHHRRGHRPRGVGVHGSGSVPRHRENVRTARDGPICRASSSGAIPVSSPADRSSGCALLALSRPSPISSSATRVTSALDPLVADGILELLMRLQRRSRSVLRVHHSRHGDGARHRRRDRGAQGTVG